jgi:dUTP pyrophosphatase
LTLRVPIQRVEDAGDLPLPRYATEGAAGMDLYAALPAEISLAPGERSLIPTGVRLALPEGYEAQVRPRSGLALRHGLTLLNAPGTIDSDYRGVVSVLMINLGQAAARIRRGDRVAQIVVAPVARVDWVEEAGELPATTREGGGFGSTGSALDG